MHQNPNGFEPQYQEYEEYQEDFASVRARTIFKPRLTKPNFILSVLVNAVRMLAMLIVLCGLALGGAVLGIAKGYIKEPYPAKDILTQWLESGKSVLFASDCHDAEQLLFGYDIHKNHIQAYI